MTITKKQRNLFWLIIVALVGIYYAPSLIMSYRQAAQARQPATYAELVQQEEARRAARPGAPKLRHRSDSTLPAVVAAEAAADREEAAAHQKAALARIPGIWSGRGAVSDRGLCDLRLEIQPEQSGQYPGFFRLSCTVFGVSGQPKMDGFGPMLSRLNPSTAILTGTVVDRGAIHFAVDKAMGPTTDGKAISSVEVLPFGTNSLSVEWKNDGQLGGQLLLSKEKS
jgi:hypothetical protein